MKSIIVKFWDWFASLGQSVPSSGEPYTGIVESEKLQNLDRIKETQVAAVEESAEEKPKSDTAF